MVAIIILFLVLGLVALAFVVAFSKQKKNEEEKED